MDFLFVKTKGRAGTFRKVVSNQTVYNEIPEFNDTHQYNDELKLQDKQWFVLENFSQKVYAPDLVKNAFDAAAWSQIDRTDYEKIDYLVSVQSYGNLLVFQNVTTSLIYKRQSWLSLDEQPALFNKERLLVIHKNADSYYRRDTDRLYFKKLSAITRIFPGINELYNEATDDEVDNALHLDILEVDLNFTKDKVKTANRRRIKEAMDMFNNYNELQKAKLPQYLKKYCPDLDCNTLNGKFMITDENTLSRLLNGLCQRYYTTEISEEKKVALSTEKV